MSNNSSLPKDSLILLRKSTIKRSKASNSFRLPSIQQHKTKNARWDIMGLPNDWVPNETPSLKLAQLHERRENRHQQCLEKMREDMARVNQGASAKIKSESKSLKKFLHECRVKVEEALNTIYVSPKIKQIKLSSTMFEDVNNVINEISTEARQEIYKLYYHLQVLERERSKQFKDILREYYPKLHEISFKLPYEIQEFFELEIQNINQITLSNYRNYEELNKQLGLKAENDLRLWLQKFETYKKGYETHCRLLQESSMKKLSQVEDDLMEAMQRNSYKLNVINGKAKTIASRVSLFENNILLTRVVMKTIIKKIYKGAYDEVVYRELSPAKNSKVLLSFPPQGLTEEVYNSLFEDQIHKSIDKYTHERISEWFTLLDSMEEEYEITSNSVERTLHLWDSHFDRLFELKELTIADLKKLMNQHTVGPDIELNKINLYIDKMRQASSEPEINGLMNEIKKCIDNINDLSISNHKSQQDFFNKFRNFMNIEADFLVSELKSFLDKFIKNSDVNPTVQRGRLSWLEPKVLQEKMSIMRVMENQITLLHNWNFGIHETVSFAANNTPNYIEEKMEKWISLQCVQLLRHLEFKAILHNPKFQRVYVYIYKIRLAELKLHKQRLEEHKLGVQAELKKMEKVYFANLFKYDEALKVVAAKIHGLHEKALDAKKLEAIESIKGQLKMLHDKNLQIMDNFRGDYMKYAHSTLNQIKNCSLQYLKCLR